MLIQPIFTLLNDFPATPQGHVKFLERVRDDLHYAAEAKRSQFARGYSNDTLESMVRGIKWRESGERVLALRDLFPELAEEAARVLRRELSVGTVERLDELLRPAVQVLRDALEDSASLSPSGMPQGEVTPKTGDDPQTDADLRREFMEMAVAQARKSVGEDDGPHPKVGAVIVKDGRVLATAY